MVFNIVFHKNYTCILGTIHTPLIITRLAFKNCAKYISCFFKATYADVSTLYRGLTQGCQELQDFKTPMFSTIFHIGT